MNTPSGDYGVTPHDPRAPQNPPAFVPPHAPIGATAKGLAITAVVVGGVAFVFGWVPVLGAILGAGGTVLGVLALLKRQNKLLSISAIVLSGLAFLTSLIITIAVVIAAAGSTSEPLPVTAPPASSAPSETTTPTPTPTVTPSSAPPALPPASPAPLVAPEPVVDVAVFASEAHRHVADLNKDLDDMVERTNNRQMFRLLGNSVELSFNHAQLAALDVPPTIADEYSAALAQLEAGIDMVSNATSQYVADELDAGSVLGVIDAVRGQVAVVDAVVAQMG